jgi:hypothetical protein
MTGLPSLFSNLLYGKDFPKFVDQRVTIFINGGKEYLGVWHRLSSIFETPPECLKASPKIESGKKFLQKNY